MNNIDNNIIIDSQDKINNYINQDKDNYIDSYLQLAIEINNNIDKIIEYPSVNRYIDQSGNIIERYQTLWNDLNYNQVLSCYLSLLCYCYKNI